MNNNFAKQFYLAFALICSLTASSASAVIYLTGSFSTSTSNVPLQTYDSNGASGTIAFDVGPYLRLGYTHKQQFDVTEGYKETKDDAGTEGFTYFKNKLQKVSNSVDVTIILYRGDFFMPYLMAGAITKHYYYDYTEGDANLKADAPYGPVLNLGAGIGLRLNREFSLKITYLVSPGIYQEPNGEEKSVYDKYTEVGLTYQL